MTFEQRMAELGVDLSDLPYPDSGRMNAILKGVSDKDKIHALKQSYIRLVDIIDRMETRIVNLTGERDYLRWKYSADPNETVPEDWCPDA